MSALIKGIDISKYQRANLFNWSLIAREFKFVIARACFGTKSDPLLEGHINNARRVGCKVGAYIFYRQTQGWREQFEAFDGELDRICLKAGDLPPVVDLEHPPKYDGKTKRTKFNEDARLLCEALAKKYGKVIIYTSPGFYGILGKPEWMNDDRYVIWLAHYTTADEPMKTPGLKAWTIWQKEADTFYNKDGSVKLKGGRALGYASGKRDIDVDYAKEIPLLEEFKVQEAPEEGYEHPRDVGDPDRPVEVAEEDEFSEDEPDEEVNPPEEDEPDEPETPVSSPPEATEETTRTRPGLSAIFVVLAAILGGLLSQWMW